jgi:phage protein D/phage baseplate assembly protein gpV
MNGLVPLPRITAHVGGKALDPRQIVQVRVRRAASLPAQCEMAVLGGGRDVSGLAPGHPFSVCLQGFDAPLFEGEITAFEAIHGPSQDSVLRVRGYDRLHRLRRRQSVRQYVDTTIAAVARDLLADLGISVAEHAAAPTWQRVVQFARTDLDFLRHLAARSGLHFSLQGDELSLFSLAGLSAAGDEPIALVLAGNLLEAGVEVNADGFCDEVEVSGWNPQDAGALQASAGQGRTPQASAVRALSEGTGLAQRHFLVDRVCHDEAQAQALAQAHLDFCQASGRILRGLAEGDPALRPGAVVELTGMAADLAGRYVLTAVTHTIDSRRGFVTEIDTAPPPPICPSRGTITALGIVVNVDDPQRWGRVRVRLPSYADLETGWLEVALPAAGKHKGLVALPDVDDRVITLLPGEDAAHGLVIGGLFGTREPPDDAAAHDAVRRFSFRTPQGQLVRLDDRRGEVLIRNSSGSSVRVGRDGIVVRAEGNLELAAPGKQITLKATDINFEKA